MRLNFDEMSFEEVCHKISGIYNKKEEVELEDLEQLFIKFTKTLFTRVFQVDRPPEVSVADNDLYAGCYNGYKTFEINRCRIQSFQNGEALELFETICHELTHFAQKRNFEKINILNSIMEKDEYIKSFDPSYYRNNYLLLASEKDCYLSQSREAISLLKALGITPSEEEMRKSNEKREEFEEGVLTTKRIINEEVRDLDDIFLEKFNENIGNLDDYDRKNFFKFRPCLALEHSIVDNKLVRKNADEMNLLYSEWQKGGLDLIGNSDEIDLYFKFVISKSKSADLETENKSKQ